MICGRYISKQVLFTSLFTFRFDGFSSLFAQGELFIEGTARRLPVLIMEGVIDLFVDFVELLFDEDVPAELFDEEFWVNCPNMDN